METLNRIVFALLLVLDCPSSDYKDEEEDEDEDERFMTGDGRRQPPSLRR